MAKRGIDNVLGRLIESPEPPAEIPEAAATALPPQPEKIAAPVDRIRGARRGRPPGSRAGEGGNKVKKTFAIDTHLYDACVARSWQEQRQMGEVIEIALRLYLKTPIKQ